MIQRSATNTALTKSAVLFGIAALIFLLSIILASYIQVTRNWSNQVKIANGLFSKTVVTNLWHFDFRGVQENANATAQLWSLDRIVVKDQFDIVVVDTNPNMDLRPAEQFNDILGINEKVIGQVSFWIGKPPSLTHGILLSSLLLLSIALPILGFLYWRLKNILHSLFGQPLKQLNDAIDQSRLTDIPNWPAFEHIEFSKIVSTYESMLRRITKIDKDKQVIAERTDNIITSFYSMMEQTDQSFLVETDTGETFVEQATSTLDAPTLKSLLNILKNRSPTAASIENLGLEVRQWAYRQENAQLLEIATKTGETLSVHFRALPNGFNAISTVNISELRRTEIVLDAILIQADIGVAVFSATGNLEIERAVRLNRIGALTPKKLNYNSIVHNVKSASVQDVISSDNKYDVHYCEIGNDIIEFALLNLPSGYRCVIHKNTTAQKKAENLLQNAAKMNAIGQLTSGVAHDFNNILSIIVSSLELYCNTNENSSNNKLISTAISSAWHGASVARQLSELSSIQEADKQVVNIDTIIKDNHLLLETPVNDNIDLVIDLNSKLHIRVDPKKLISSLLNAVLNSNDAIDQNGTISIITNDVSPEKENSSPFVEIIVRDTGHGIPKQLKTNIFDPFFTTKPIGKGAGLGLATLDTFVKQSAGTVSVNSSSAGTELIIRLPNFELESDSTHWVPPLTDSPKNLIRKNIVMVDDNTTLLTLFAKGLAQDGHTITVYDDAINAVDALPSLVTPDVLIVDLRMSGLSGVEVANRYASAFPHIRIALVTGNIIDETIQLRNNPDIHEIFSKPVELSVLKNFVAV